MNPDSLPFCIDNLHPSVNIPLRFNQTRPIHVELIRFDFDTNANETVILSSKERKRTWEDKENSVSIAFYPAKKPGLYRLHKVIDESKLEVQRRMSDTLVVKCPQVAVKSTGSDRCLGDLSDLNMEIEGTAPLKIVYTRTVNKEESTHHFQSIQPENFASPLLGTTRFTSLVLSGTPNLSWARTHRVKVPLNESMIPGGRWTYSIDEIHDAIGNVANFSARGEDGEHIYPRGRHLEESFMVHERPLAQLSGCDTRNPLMVANGKKTDLPVNYLYSGKNIDHLSHTLTWKFSPLDSLTASGDHSSDTRIEKFEAKTAHSKPSIRDAGLYTLIGVKSRYCEGEIREPASCLLLNPPEPKLTITAENISDKCAGNSIGLIVDLDLIGTPPFVVRYQIQGTNRPTTSESVEVSGLRHQLELKPRNAGHFKYQFIEISDSVYNDHKLDDKALVLEQDVRPPASAQLRRPAGPIDACIEEPVAMDVDLSGEPPFTLEYELVHNGKRTKTKVASIKTVEFQIKTEALVNGGEYSLALASIQDQTGCKIFLNSEVKFTVRHQRPKASFGHIDGKHTTTEIEGKQINLPLRLTGRAPWTVKYRNINDTSGQNTIKRAKSTNDFITVNQEGTYEILDVSDDKCFGTVDPVASIFTVKWLARPHMKLAQTATLNATGDKYIKREVCEGDIDAVEINLIGKVLVSRFIRTADI
jgi:nucleoporin POM152